MTRCNQNPRTLVKYEINLNQYMLIHFQPHYHQNNKYNTHDLYAYVLLGFIIKLMLYKFYPFEDLGRLAQYLPLGLISAIISATHSTLPLRGVGIMILDK